jgi:hypothetical protein
VLTLAVTMAWALPPGRAWASEDGSQPEPDVVAAALEELGGKLAAGDPEAARQLEAMVDGAPSSPAAADALFAAARALEEGGGDPVGAHRLYQRIARDHPGARVAVAAERRRAALAALLGSSSEDAARATRLIRILGQAPEAITAQTKDEMSALSRAAWPGAPRAALWLADHQRRTGPGGAAIQAYRRVFTEFPGSPEAVPAMRALITVAIEQGDLAQAEDTLQQLPIATTTDLAQHDDLAETLRRAILGRRLLRASVLALILSCLGLLASWLQAAGSVGALARSLLPPMEILYLAPIAGGFVIASLTGHPAIAPAVTRIVGGGLAITWISGAALRAARDRGLAMGRRAGLHAVLVTIATVSLCYLVLSLDGLREMIAETVRFGPSPPP